MKIFLTSYPKLLKEWHPEKNKDISPSNLSHGSIKVYGGYAIVEMNIKQRYIIEP